MTDIRFKAPTPELTLSCLGTKAAGRCYTITTYEVRSTKKLQHAVFAGLREAGLLGYGQGFSVSSPREEQELLVPVSIDEATGKVLAEGYETVLNPYSRQPYKEAHRTIYVYTVKSECDSGD
jgi:hypothetical protein